MSERRTVAELEDASLWTVLPFMLVSGRFRRWLALQHGDFKTVAATKVRDLVVHQALRLHWALNAVTFLILMVMGATIGHPHEIMTGATVGSAAITALFMWRLARLEPHVILGPHIILAPALAAHLLPLYAVGYRF